jgi:PAS domain S-box-containing protein
MLDAGGHVASWNMGAQRIKGYTAGQIVGRHFSTFYTPQDRAAGLPAQALATAAREGRYEKEGLRMRKDGTSFMAHVVIDHQDGRDVFPIGNRFIFAAHEIFVLGYVE